MVKLKIMLSPNTSGLASFAYCTDFGTDNSVERVFITDDVTPLYRIAWSAAAVTDTAVDGVPPPLYANDKPTQVLFTPPRRATRRVLVTRCL